MAAEFETLTRRHGVRLSPSLPVTVEECSLALGELVGYGSVKSASRMSNAVVIFLDDEVKVNRVVGQGLRVRGTLVPVMPLSNPAKRVVISNSPPFLTNAALERELSRHGQLLSPIRRLPLGCSSPLLKHVMSFRREVFMKLHDNHNNELNIALKFKVDGFDYTVYATTDPMKCFGCGREGHQIRSCPARAGQGRQAEAIGTGEEPAAPAGAEAPSESEAELAAPPGAEAPVESAAGPPAEVPTAGSSPLPAEPTAEPAVPPPRPQTGAQEAEGLTAGAADGEAEERSGRTDVTVDGAEGEQRATEEMEEDQPPLSAPQKRKTRVCHTQRETRRTVKRAKEETGAEEYGGSDGEPEKRRFPPSDDVMNRVYSLEKLRAFLQKTKHMRNVDVRDYFPSRSDFFYALHTRLHDSAAVAEEERFTSPEFHRARKYLTRLRKEFQVEFGQEESELSGSD